MQEFLTQPDGNLRRPKFVGVLASLSPSLKAIFILAFLVFIVTSFALLGDFSERFLVEVPRRGGELTEGIIGRPRFINPVIAKSDADRDMVKLIYSGLMKATPEGELIPDLAAHYEVSEDGLTYTFVLRDELYWHDGEPVTALDIAYTIEKVRDPGLAIKSPRRAAWEGVDVEMSDQKTIIFKIKQPYAGFLENATMEIIPKHIWENVPNEEFDVTYYNIEPIGSGPYRIKQIKRDAEKGLPSWYDLVAFKRYSLGEPFITKFRIRFFGNNKEMSQAYADGTIHQMHTIEPAFATQLKEKGAMIDQTPLPRVFAAYFNQNQQPIFTDQKVREALGLAVDKERIVSEVLFGYGIPINGPLPFLENIQNNLETESAEARVEKARAILEGAGWAPNAAGVYEKTIKAKKQVQLLEFSIAIPDVAELRHAAELMKHDWEKLGALVTLKVYEPSTFAVEVLSPRKYDVLFYGQVIARTPDPFVYWHSSQRNAPGLNVALYANKTVDNLLESARKERDEIERSLLLTKFSETLSSDTPAIFLYSPDFLYAISPRVRGMKTGLITTESERFLDIHQWHVESEHVWKWFVQENDSNQDGTDAHTDEHAKMSEEGISPQ